MNGLKEMALEAQLPHNFYTGEPMWVDRLEAFAKLVAAKEREACAKVCDSEKKWWNGMSHAENDIYQAIDNISACIRARGDE